MERITVSQEQIDTINERYGTSASPDDVEHYKLCQVILHLEGLVDPDKLPNVENNGEK